MAQLGKVGLQSAGGSVVQIKKMDAKASCRCATAAALPACTYTAATKTLTANVNGALGNIDTTVAVIVGDSVLVKTQGGGASHVQNGIYKVESVGGLGSKWSMKRRDDCDTSEKVTNGVVTWIGEGTANGSTQQVLVTPDPIVLDTTPLQFSTIGLGGISGSGAANQLTYWTAASVIAGLGNATNGQIPIGSTGAAPVLASLTAGSGITITPGAGSISIASNLTGTGTNNKVTKWTGANTIGDSSTTDDGKLLTVAPNASTSGSPTIYTLTAPAHTGLANAEATDIYLNLNRIVTLTGGGGAIANMRAVYLTAPDYRAGGGGQTITNAATFSISGPPTSGDASVTFTAVNALQVESGNVLFSGLIKAGSGPTTLTDSAGKILSAALNTVAVAQGGTNVTSWNAYAVVYASASNTLGEVGSIKLRPVADPGAFTAVADTDGADTYIRTQSGGAASAPPNPRGGDLLIKLGAGGAGGTGRAGQFDIEGKFVVDANGDIIKLKNLTYAFPAAHAIGSLVNDGSGNLTWSAAPSADPWSALTAPVGSLSLAHAAYTTTFTWNATTGANDLFTLQDTASNTGTGYILTVGTASGSAAKAFQIKSLGSAVFATDVRGGLVLSPTAAASGSPTLLTLTAPAHTTLANAEATDVYVNLARAVTLTGGGGAIASQRAVRITAPTYAAGLAQTITSAATFSVSGAPVVGANITYTNVKAFEVESGESWFQGDVRVFGGSPMLYIGNAPQGSASGAALVLNYSASGAAIYAQDFTGPYTAMAFSASIYKFWNGVGVEVDLYLGHAADNNPSIIRASNGFGANLIGGVLALSPGSGTGTANSGNLVLRFAPATTSSSTVNTKFDSLKLNCVDPGSFAHPTTDAHGLDTYFRTQTGGLKSGTDTRGGDLIIKLGAAGSGSSGRAGQFSIDAKFIVDTNGDPIKIKNLTYSWPSSHVAGYLKDDGSGNLTWATVTSVTAYVDLTDASPIAVDASLASPSFTVMRVLLTAGVGATRQLANPTNATDGQIIQFRFKQSSGGSNALTFGTNYRFGTDITGATLSTAADTVDYLTVRYDATDGKWDVIGFAKGYA